MTATRLLPYIGGKTNVAAALQLLTNTAYLQSNGGREDAQRVAVLVVNGQSTINQNQVRTRLLVIHFFCV